MKILSKKRYSKLIDDFEELEDTCKELEKTNQKMKEILENKKTSCRVNAGKEFCFKCKNSYRYREYWGGMEVEKCGCLLNVSCEQFKMVDGERSKQ